MKKIIVLFVVFAVIFTACSKPPIKTIKTEPTDDWAYSGPEYESDYFVGSGSSGGITGAPSVGAPKLLSPSSSPMSESLGFSTGGAKDINNFRENIQNDYLPLPTDITYEGLFYDYYFDADRPDECEELFCPSYTSAISADPFSNDENYYLAVGLNSNIKESDFERKKLNLVIVLDISGSMGSPFESYYYDSSGGNDEDSGAGKTKMQIANESIVALLDHLNDTDRFGMVVFDDSGYLAKPMSLVAETNMEKIKKHILELTEQGGTNMSAGMEEGTKLFEDLAEIRRWDERDFYDPEYENRIIFLTDAMPNTGDISEEGMLGTTKKNARNGIYSTFIGIGVDFNTELIESITKVEGANYYSVNSADEFKKRMDEEFEYMVTPLVFDLTLNLEADGYEIEQVYGSPEANEATGEIMKVNTLFPSATTEEGTKGGVILLKLAKTSSNSQLTLTVSYEDREGEDFESSAKVEFKGKESEYFENDGIRKAVLLARYADLLKDWIIDERKALNDGGPIIMPMVSYERGIIVPPPEVDWPQMLGQWERRSADLMVSNAYVKLFEIFKDYFEEEMSEIGDEKLKQEVDIMNILVNYDDWLLN